MYVHQLCPNTFARIAREFPLSPRIFLFSFSFVLPVFFFFPSLFYLSFFLFLSSSFFFLVLTVISKIKVHGWYPGYNGVVKILSSLVFYGGIGLRLLGIREVYEGC